MFFVCRTKLGYTKFEAEHIYFGEYLEQFEAYKKYHNLEMNQMIFTEEEKEKERIEEKPPQWVIEAERNLQNV